MYLIPIEMYERIFAQKKPLEDKLYSLDKEMENLIEDNNQDDFTKALSHQQTLRKYLNYKKQNNKRFKPDDEDIKTEPNIKSELKTEVDTESEISEISEIKTPEIKTPIRELSYEKAADNVSKTYKDKAINILKSLPSELGWNKRGKIIHEGRILENSDLRKIIRALASNSATLKEQASKIEGWDLMKSLSRQDTTTKSRQWQRL